MEYKILGSRGPSEQFVNQLNALAELNDVQREALAVWFESTSDYDIFTPELPPSIAASPLLPDQFREAAAPLLEILNAWERRSLELTDIERDLLLFGLSPQQIQTVTGLLQRLSTVKKRVWRNALEDAAHSFGVPSIDDANIIWDARGIFGGSSFYFSPDDANERSYKHCLGLTCMAIFEFMASDSNGTRQRFAFQMDEAAFHRFLRAVNRASEQLESLKALIAPVTAVQPASEG